MGSKAWRRMLGIAAAAGLVLGGVGAEELSIEVDLVWVVVSLEHDAACYVFGCAAVSGTGNAQGTYAVSGTGAATGCEPEFYDPILYFHEPCFAASGAGDATGAWAVTATGDAEGRHSFCATVGPPTQLVITGACLTQVAVSGTGRARACGGGEEVHCGIAVSGTGPAEAWIGVSGANDCGGTRCFDGQAVGPAEADTLAVSVLGPSSSKLLAVSVLGDSSSESAAVSVLGEASGPSSVSALGLSQQVASCNCVAVAVGEDASAEVLAVSAFGDASGLAALSGTGGSQGTAAASATGPAEGIVATSALGPATGRQLAASLGGPAATSGPCSDACVALSGTGPAHACSAPPFVLEHHVVGCTAVSVAGPSSSCESCSGTAVSVLGPASGGIAASGAGDADAGMENAILYSVGDAGIAVSGLGDAHACYDSGVDGELCAVAVSGAGTATGGTTISGIGDAHSHDIGCFWMACTPGLAMTLMGNADATCHYGTFWDCGTAVSGTGDASGRVAVSGTGHADGSAYSLSGCDLAGACL